MSKHTPGKWVYREANSRCIGPVCQDDTQDYGMQLSVARIDAFDFPEQYEANAHLIAAAPDLYAALVDMMAASAGGEKSCGHEFLCVCQFDNAKKAIAKAKGE